MYEAEFLAYEDGLDGRTIQAVGKGFVFAGAFGSQFAHAAQDGHFVGHGQGLEVVERHFHAGGVGVVAVEEEGVACGLFVLRAAVGGLVLLDGLLYVPGLYVEEEACGDGGHAVVEVVVAQEVGADVVDVVVHLEVEVEVWGAAHKGAAGLGGAAAVGYGFQAAVGGLCGKCGVVGIDEGGAAFGRQVAVEFGLGLHNALKAAKAFKVGTAHVGDEAEVGVGNAAEVGYLAGVAGSHFDDGYLGVGGDGEEGERHAEVVVVVADGGMGAVAAGEDGVDEFFGGGLAIGAGDAYEGDGELAAVVGGQLLQGGKHVGYHNAAVVDLVLGVADDAQGGSLVESLGCEGVAVEGLPTEGKEKTSGGYMPRVSSDGAGLQIGMI